MNTLEQTPADKLDLNEIGVGVAEGGVVTDLSNRLLIEGWRRDHPEVATQRVDRPIIIVGQPRTGTTILFVTHSLGLVEKMCDDALWLHHGRAVVRLGQRRGQGRIARSVGARGER